MVITTFAKGLLRHRPVGREVVGRIVIDRINVIHVDEGFDVDRLGRLDPHLVEILLVDDHVLILLVLIALDEVAPLDLPELGVDRLHRDAIMGILVEEVEGDVGVRPESDASVRHRACERDDRASARAGHTSGARCERRSWRCRAAQDSSPGRASDTPSSLHAVPSCKTSNAITPEQAADAT